MKNIEKLKLLEKKYGNPMYTITAYYDVICSWEWESIPFKPDQIYKEFKAEAEELYEKQKENYTVEITEENRSKLLGESYFQELIEKIYYDEE